MDKTAAMRIRVDEEFDSMLKRLSHESSVLLIMGIGFDRRMNIGLQHFVDAEIIPEVWAIEHSKYEGEDPTQVEKAKGNRAQFFALCEEHGIRPDVYEIEMWSKDQTTPFLTAEFNAARYIKKRIAYLEHYNYIFVDISALPRSIYFNFIRMLDFLTLPKASMFVLVSENCATDMEMRPIENDEKAHEVVGFTSKSNQHVDNAACIWLPVLGETERETLQKEHEFIQGRYGSIDDVIPVLPFPSRIAKRADGLLKHYDRQLFSAWGVDKSNIVYVAEDRPFQIAGRLEAIVKRYSDLMEGLVNGENRQGRCQFVFSAISSKLMRLGTLIAILTLKKSGYHVSLVDVSCHGYKSIKSRENTQAFERVPDRLFCVPLSAALPECRKPQVVGAGLFCTDIISHTDFRDTNSERVIQSGGSCGNVLAVLRYHGWRAVAVLRESDDRITRMAIDDINAQGIETIFTKRRGSIPRILITIGSDGNPSHKRICPGCGTNTFQFKPLDERDLKTVKVSFNQGDCFYHDRLNAGTRALCALARNAKALVFFEPNSARNKSAMMEHALHCDIVKFSSAYVSDKISDELLARVHPEDRIKLLVRTKGSEGLQFSCRQENGVMSRWLNVAPALDTAHPFVDTSGLGDWLSAGIIDSLTKRGFNRLYLHEDDVRLVLEDASTWVREGASGRGAQGALIGESFFESRKINGVSYKTPYKGLLNEIDSNERCLVCLSTIGGGPVRSGSFREP